MSWMQFISICQCEGHSLQVRKEPIWNVPTTGEYSFICGIARISLQKLH